MKQGSWSTLKLCSLTLHSGHCFLNKCACLLCPHLPAMVQDYNIPTTNNCRSLNLFLFSLVVTELCMSYNYLNYHTLQVTIGLITPLKVGTRMLVKGSPDRMVLQLSQLWRGLVQQQAAMAMLRLVHATMVMRVYFVHCVQLSSAPVPGTIADPQKCTLGTTALACMVWL